MGVLVVTRRCWDSVPFGGCDWGEDEFGEPAFGSQLIAAPEPAADFAEGGDGFAADHGEVACAEGLDYGGVGVVGTLEDFVGNVAAAAVAGSDPDPSWP